MPPLSSSAHLRNTLRKFRLVAARAIIRNLSNTFSVQPDIQNTHDIAELCDDYCLQMLLCWLATKYGFPAYLQSTKSNAADMLQEDTGLVRLQNWPSLSSEYPLAGAMPIHDLDIHLIELLDSLDMRIELVGNLYEHIREYPLTLNKAGQPDIKKSINRRSLGQYYTPPAAVRYCLDAALEKDSAYFMSRIKAACTARSQAQPSAHFKMMDPACGTGNFLLGSLHWLRQLGLSPEAQFRFTRDALFGLEIDGRAASLCRLSLVIALSNHFYGMSLKTGMKQIDSALGDLIAELRKHIVVGDSLFSGSAEQSDQQQFDLVATNPPYLSFGSRNHIQMPDSWIAYLKASYPEASQYKIRLHSIFQDIALRYAKCGGRVVLLVPDSFLTGSFYEKLRTKLLKEARIESLTELPDNTISGATVGRWCVAVYRKQPDLDISDHAVNLYRVEREELSSGCLKPAQQYAVPLSLFVTKDKARFRMMFDDIERDIWLATDKLPCLGEILKGRTGIRSINGQSMIIAGQKKGLKWQRGIASGSQVTRHRTSWDGNWLHVRPEILFSGGFDKAVIESPKLLVRQTADRIIAGYDDSGLYHLNNVHSFSLRQARTGLQPASGGGNTGTVNELHYFDGLLNSSFWLYLYQLKTREENRALAQIDIETVECMPLPQANAEIMALIGRLTRCAGRLICSTGVASGAPTDLNLLSFIERCIDRLVYVAYALTAEQIEYIESSCRVRLPYNRALPTVDEVKELAAQIAEAGSNACELPDEVSHAI